jgi:hypothetical protein
MNQQYVLEPCNPPASVNTEQLKGYVENYMGGRREFYRETTRSPYIEDEFSEWWTAKASRGIEIGKGSGGMDVKTGVGEGIDAMCVVMNSNGSNEKSLMQNFSEAGANLDTLFIEGKDSDALELFTKGYSEKIMNIKETAGLTDLYILAFVSTMSDIYLVCLKLNPDLISDVRSGGFVGNQGKNIIAKNFINPELGDVKLYKSKKRLELRFKKKVLDSEYVVKLYTLC